MQKRMMWLAAIVALLSGCLSAVAMAGVVEEEEGPESAVSAPPMEMDDPGTPGPQGLEINFVGSLDRTGPNQRAGMLLDANYGIGDRIQLKYERPYVNQNEGNAPPQQGLGATEIGIKWRAVDHRGLAVAFYPNYQMNDAFVLMDAEGAPEQSEGRSIYLPVLISKEMHRLYTIAANVGYRRNLDGRGDDAVLALGAGRAMGGNGRILVEVITERDHRLHNRQTDAHLGYVLSLFSKSFAQSQYDLPIYAAFGHSIGNTEINEQRLSFTIGMSIIKKPKP